MRAIAIVALLITGATMAEGGAEMSVTPMTQEQLARHSVRVAAVQVDSPWMWGLPVDPNRDPADIAVRYIERAAEDGADLVVLPELWLGMFRVPSPQTEKVAAAARAGNINVIVGCFEVLDEEGRYANSTLVFNREGAVIGRFFKLYQAVGEGPYLWPPKEDDPEWMMEPGQEFPVFDLDFGRIGILTCYDGYFPEPWRILALKGAEIIIWPNARGGSIEDYIVLTNMQQNYVHIVATNKSMGSGTMIAEWPRAIKAIADKPEETYLIENLHLNRLREARANAREFHQRRPGMYHEILNKWNVWEQYGIENPVGLNVPEPSGEARQRILENAQIPFKRNGAE